MGILQGEVRPWHSRGLHLNLLKGSTKRAGTLCTPLPSPACATPGTKVPTLCPASCYAEPPEDSVPPLHPSAGVNSYIVGEGLELAEQEWLAQVINDHIEQNKCGGAWAAPPLKQ